VSIRQNSPIYRHLAIVIRVNRDVHLEAHHLLGALGRILRAGAADERLINGPEGPAGVPTGHHHDAEV
jgi:hypothetical protein